MLSQPVLDRVRARITTPPVEPASRVGQTGTKRRASGVVGVRFYTSNSWTVVCLPFSASFKQRSRRRTNDMTLSQLFHR